MLKTDGFGTRTRARARRFLPQKWECTEKLRVAEAGCRFRAESLSPTISPTHAREPNGNEVGDADDGAGLLGAGVGCFGRASSWLRPVAKVDGYTGLTCVKLAGSRRSHYANKCPPRDRAVDRRFRGLSIRCGLSARGSLVALPRRVGFALQVIRHAAQFTRDLWSAKLVRSLIQKSDFIHGKPTKLATRPLPSLWQ